MGTSTAAFHQFEHFDNLVEMFFARAEANGHKPFLVARKDNGWQAISWHDTARQVTALALSLRELGVQAGDRVMLVSENRPEWCIADLAIMAAGGVTVPTYTTNTERDHSHILSDSGARFVIFSNQKIGQNLLPAVMRAPAVAAVITMEPVKTGQGHCHHATWAHLLARPVTDADIHMLRDSCTAKRADLACIIYTSGTGGVPRGVMQHHGAILLNVAGAFALVAEDFGIADERFLSFLPLSHSYEHTGGQFLPIGLGGEIWYAEGLDKLASNIEESSPTIMVVVPRLFEVLRQKIVKQIEKKGGVATWLLDRALRNAERQAEGRASLLDWPIERLLDRTLRPQIQARFGGRIKAMVSGGAPLNPEVGRFFSAMGLTLLQGYGQTEAAPIISCNRPKTGIAMHTVGPPIDGVEVRIAEDGEILVRGEIVMHGYWNNPAETAKALQHGWLHSGDVGHIDELGRIVITDRKKDLIVNDKGDNVSPQRVEGMLTLQPEILQAMVIGDRRPHLVGLIVPDPEWVNTWAAAGHDPTDRAALTKAVMAAVDRVNRDISVIEKVRRICLADAPFTVENEMLTPSMKIRRHQIRAIYGDRLEALYGSH
jgi:long-chain acyl-CoA synthetase